MRIRLGLDGCGWGLLCALPYAFVLSLAFRPPFVLLSIPH